MQTFGKPLQSCFILLVSLVTLMIVKPAHAHEDILKAPNCPLCGMDREKFAHSRVYIRYSDNSVFGGCSIHCAAVEFSLNIDKAPLSIEVGDYDSKELIDAENAVWVIGGDLPGVMTRRAKWAFSSETAARKFIEKHGGAKADFDQVMEATYADMYADVKMIQEKRKKMRAMKHNSVGNK